MPLRDEERLFIEVLREVNHQASILQAVEKGMSAEPLPSAGSENSKESQHDHDYSALQRSLHHSEHQSEQHSQQRSQHSQQHSEHSDQSEEESRSSADPPAAPRRWGQHEADMNLDAATAAALQAAHRMHQATHSANSAHSGFQSAQTTHSSAHNAHSQEHVSALRAAGASSGDTTRTVAAANAPQPLHSKRSAAAAGLDPV